jgi:hypothetical protein
MFTFLKCLVEQTNLKPTRLIIRAEIKICQKGKSRDNSRK